MYILSILIPTYKRLRFLEKNISFLSKIITSNNWQENICILVSDNHSDDGTFEFMSAKDKENEFIFFVEQERNIGAEENFLYLLKWAKSSYIMFLGDDDYLSPQYVSDVMRYISTRRIGAIIPNVINIDEEGKRTDEWMRDKDCKNTLIESGNGCLKYSFLGHQMSGLVFKRDGLYEQYMSSGYHTMYPTVYFLAYNILRYPFVLAFREPISVTQNKIKHWGYSEDGLIGELFTPFIILRVPYFRRIYLELYYQFAFNGVKVVYLVNQDFFKFLKKIFSSNAITIVGKICYSLQFLLVCVAGKIKKK